MGFTYISHVKGVKSGISISKHGIDCIISVHATPSTTRLPHPVDDPANIYRIIPFSNHGSMLILSLHTHKGSRSWVRTSRPGFSFGFPLGFDGTEDEFATWVLQQLCHLQMEWLPNNMRRQDREFQNQELMTSMYCLLNKVWRVLCFILSASTALLPTVSSVRIHLYSLDSPSSFLF